MNIGGNLTALVQVKDKGVENQIGEKEHKWMDVIELTGFLDYQGGQNSYTTANAKIQETTHIFICGFHSYALLSKQWNWNPFFSNDIATKEQEIKLTSENGRMVINGDVYDILLIDDPMNMHQHLEIYLKYVGGGQGVS